MRVVNALGILIEQTDNVSAGENLTFGGRYKPGIYFVEIINGNERKQLRILKQ
jgi:hypothetical protein